MISSNNNKKYKITKQSNELIIPDYIIIKILNYLIQDKFIITENSNSNSKKNCYYYNRYKKSKINNNNNSILNLNFNYSIVCWKWFKITTKLNYFLPRRFLISLINRNNNNDNNYYNQIIDSHDDDDSSSDEEDSINKNLTIKKIEEKIRNNNFSLFYTSLKYGWFQFKNLIEIEFDLITPTWFTAWQLLIKESPNLEIIHLTIVVGNDNPIEIFERFPIDHSLKLNLKLYFNDLYCNLETIEQYQSSKRLPPSSKLNIQSIQCICNIHQEMNWDIVKFFNPIKLLLDSSFETTYHYSYNDLLDNNNNSSSSNSNLNEFKLKSHDFLDFKDFKIALDNLNLKSLECNLLLYDLHSFEHIIPEIGGQVYWNSISCDTNDNASSLVSCINSISKSLADNNSLTNLSISDYYRYYDDDDSTIYNGYDIEKVFLDKPPSLSYQLDYNHHSSSSIPSIPIDPFQDTFHIDENFENQYKTFAIQFSESISKNNTLKSLYISSWDSLLSDYHSNIKLTTSTTIISYDCKFFKSISINKSITKLSLVNDTISDIDIKCLSFYIGKNFILKSLILTNNNLKQVDKLIDLLNSTSIRSIPLSLDLSNNHYSIKSSNQIYQSISLNFKFINQLILPINFKLIIEQLNLKNKFNIIFK